jgi:hypothetical protein
MIIAVCDCVQCAVRGVWHFNSCSLRGVRSSVWQYARQYAVVRQCAAVWSSATVYGSAHGCLRQCTRMCAAVDLLVRGGV